MKTSWNCFVTDLFVVFVTETNSEDRFKMHCKQLHVNCMKFIHKDLTLSNLRSLWVWIHTKNKKEARMTRVISTTRSNQSTSQTDRQTDRQADGQTDRERRPPLRQKDCIGDRHTHSDIPTEICHMLCESKGATPPTPTPLPAPPSNSFPFLFSSETEQLYTKGSKRH